MSYPASFYPTLFQALIPRLPQPLRSHTGLSSLLGMGIGIGFLWLMAQITVTLPFTPVPITGQTLGVMWVGALLGARLGFVTVIGYLLLGSVGLPVFSAGGEGLDQILGPTGGYLLAFPLAATLIGSLVQRFGVDRQTPKLCLSLLLCSLMVFVTGATWLGVWLQGAGRYQGIWSVLQSGVIPFIPGDLIKSGLTSVLLPLGWRWLSPQSLSATQE